MTILSNRWTHRVLTVVGAIALVAVATGCSVDSTDQIERDNIATDSTSSTASTGGGDEGGVEGDGRPFLANSEFVPDTLIPADHYQVHNARCAPRQAEVVVDGETVDGIVWWFEAILTNLLDMASPHYGIGAIATLENGETFEAPPISFHSVGAGESGDFKVLLGSEHLLGSPVASCEPVVTDSVLNYDE